MSKPYQIGEFVLESKLGAGGMGVVFRARQVSLQRWVALKLLSKPAGSGSRFVDRFYREARATAQLIHPNIIQTYTIGEHKGAPYYAMEYVEGKDLASILEKHEQLSIDESVEIVRCVAKGLALASEHGIVHRDIKPANIMVAKSGSVKVMDFGLAKAAAVDESLTQDGQIIGTPSYMSPEQGTGQEVDCRSDLYSLGCLMYECLAGRPPFEADNVPAIIFKQLYEAPQPPSQVNPAIPKELESICLKLMAKSPADRYSTPADLLEALIAIPFNSAAGESALAQKVKAMAQGAAPSPAFGDEIPKEIEETIQKPRPPSGPRPGSVLQATPITALPTHRPQSSRRVLPATMIEPPLLAGGSQSPPAAETSRSAPPAADADSKKTLIRDKKTLHSPPPPPSSPAAEPKAAPPPVGEIRSAPPVGEIRPAPPVGEIRSAPAVATELKAPLAPAEPRLTPAPKEPAPELPLRIPPPPRPSSSTKTLPAVGPDPLAPGAPAKSSKTQRLAKASFSSRRAGQRVSPYFVRKPDQKWGYDATQGHCQYAEGLAAEPLPGAKAQLGALGDCLVCANWSRRFGCAVAATQESEGQSRAKGADLAEELAVIWCTAGRFDMAIETLEDYIREFSQDPAGYHALARIYERPDFAGKDRSRAIVLYGRFLALVKEHGGYTEMELLRARERMEALQAGQARKEGAGAGPGVPGEIQNALHSFRCFYRGEGLFYALGAVDRTRLVVARLGEVDPETGVSATSVGSALQFASRMFHKIKSEKAKSAEREAVRKELQRLSRSPLEQLEQEASGGWTLGLDKILKVTYQEGQANGFHVLCVQTALRQHEFFFALKDDIDAVRCALFLKRLTGR